MTPRLEEEPPGSVQRDRIPAGARRRGAGHHGGSCVTGWVGTARSTVPTQAGPKAAAHPATAPQGCRQPSPRPAWPCRWFHGKITREQAERLLYPPETGLFLVRESTNYPGDYTLCVSCEGKVEHYRIIYSSSKLSIDEEVYFENLMQLVEVRPPLASPVGTSELVGLQGWRGGGDAGDTGRRRRRDKGSRPPPGVSVASCCHLVGPQSSALPHTVPGCHPHPAVSPSITPRTQTGSAPASSNPS